MGDYLVWGQPSCQEQTVRMQNPRFVIPAWSAGIQIDMDVSGGVLANYLRRRPCELMDAGHPCRHDGGLHFDPPWASVS